MTGDRDVRRPSKMGPCKPLHEGQRKDRRRNIWTDWTGAGMQVFKGAIESVHWEIIEEKLERTLNGVKRAVLVGNTHVLRRDRSLEGEFDIGDSLKTPRQITQ